MKNGEPPIDEEAASKGDSTGSAPGQQPNGGTVTSVDFSTEGSKRIPSIRIAASGTPSATSDDNTSQPNGANDEAILIRISMLEQRHADLHEAIEALIETSGPSNLAVARLKKQKLRLKDQIVLLRDMLEPDIIA
ncbi:MAG: DUF465 domain-containing protein [Pseudomonadota bacterium]